METIKEVLMRRDGMSTEDADALIQEAREDLNYRLQYREFAEDICEEYFSLEPDYLFELIGF